ncbi:carboxypeptidase-like regulatory domain-containing protein [Aquimarina sp. 2201CG1-2-11]|uniref:carboxypeptidase-like regulatory domain-containing protein n=1 Tax=Aquimarina discodermiae TaxID=3231043 RepID=UPI00346250C4
MKIKLFILLACFTLSTTIAQITSRVMISGTINAPIGDDVEGVVVYNRSTNKGTITNQEGRFKISAGINDRIEVVAMQYQHFVVLVDKGSVNSKRLNIFLKETVNKLEEVVVTPYDLSGNVTVDVNKVASRQNKMSNLTTNSFPDPNDPKIDFRPDELSLVKNNAVEDKRLINGLNFVNLFKLVYDAGSTNKKIRTNDIDVKVRNMYNDQFFKDYLALEIDQINSFIVFAENNGLDEGYFKSGKELDLLQFLAYQSKQYKNQK